MALPSCFCRRDAEDGRRYSLHVFAVGTLRTGPDGLPAAPFGDNGGAQRWRTTLVSLRAMIIAGSGKVNSFFVIVNVYEDQQNCNKIGFKRHDD